MRGLLIEEEKSAMKIHFHGKKKLTGLLLTALLTMAVLGGCGSDGTGESSGDNSSMEPVYGGSVVVGIQQDIDSLDPHKATAAGTKEILFNIF